MRKFFIGVVAVVALLTFSTVGSAALINGKLARGPVVVDPVNGKITIVDDRTGKEVTFSVNPSMIPPTVIKKGMVVIIRSVQDKAGNEVVKSVKPSRKQNKNY